jgi:hypothetical protein
MLMVHGQLNRLKVIELVVKQNQKSKIEDRQFAVIQNTQEERIWTERRGTPQD